MSGIYVAYRKSTGTNFNQVESTVTAGISLSRAKIDLRQKID